MLCLYSGRFSYLSFQLTDCHLVVWLTAIHSPIPYPLPPPHTAALQWAWSIFRHVDQTKMCVNWRRSQCRVGYGTCLWLRRRFDSLLTHPPIHGKGNIILYFAPSLFALPQLAVFLQNDSLLGVCFIFSRHPINFDRVWVTWKVWTKGSSTLAL